MNKSKEKRQPIKVFVRVRPITESERSRGSPFVVECSNNREVVVNERPNDRTTKKFIFDQVFAPLSKQIDIYKFVASPLIKEVLDGYNCTIFAYGQTGTGKTYTMEGTRSANTSVGWMNDPHCGIIPRAVSHLFDELRLLGVEYSVKASFLELYNEELFDLLSPVDDSSKIRLFEDAMKKGAIIVNGLDEVPVRDKQEVYSLLERGSKKRQTAATLMNAVSSRSHTVFSITVRIREAGVEDEVLRTGKLNLVDLAGSENIGRSGAVEKRAREAGNINQSLLTLGRVITALVEKTPHIPYRESKLTRLLQESLGGCTKTCIIATISPSLCNVEETLSTLDYAHRAKNIQNKPEVNQKIGKAAFIKEYIEEIYRLKADLMATREKCGFYLAEDNYKEMVNQIESQGIEINQLLYNNKSLVELSEKKEELNRQLSESLEKYMNDLENTKAVLHETKQDRDKQVFLLQHRVETEKNLTSQAQSLLCVADSATNDVDLLHNTLHRKRNLEENNWVACQNFYSTLKEKLGQMSQVSQKFQESRLQGLDSLLQQLDSGCNACDAYSRHSSSEVNNTLQIQDEVINKMCLLNKELGTQACSQIDSVLKESSEANELNTKEVMNFLNEILIKQQQMSNELDELKRMNTPFFQDLKAKLEVQQREKQNFLSYFNRSLEELKTGIEKQERLSCYVGETTSNIQKWKEEANLTLKSLQAQIDNIDVETKPLNTFLNESDLSTIKWNIQELDGRMQDSVVQCTKKSDDMIKAINKESEKVNEKLNNLDVIPSRICEDLQQQKNIVPKRNETSLRNTHAYLEHIRKDLVHYQSSVLSTAEELQRLENQFAVKHKDSIENHVQHHLQVANTCKEEIHNGINFQKSYNSIVTCKIGEFDQLCDDFVSQEMKKDTPSGDTPQRRLFRYPRVLVCTSPHERILSRFNAVVEEDFSLERSETPHEPSMQPLEVSTSHSLEQTGISRSKSASSITVENTTTRFSCISEPSIPSAMLDKENSSLSQNTMPGKSQPIKRPVLTDHNEQC